MYRDKISFDFSFDIKIKKINKNLMFRQLYSKAVFRIPLKFAISFIITKVSVDWLYYMRQNTNFVIPRTVKLNLILDEYVRSSKRS